jgi:hypothetical protein
MLMTPERQCGDCQLCCKLLPVRSLNKAAGERCRHQSHARGCKVHARLAQVSPECGWWNCRWLGNHDAADLRRPDKSRYVLDIMPEYVTLRHNQTGECRNVQVVQIWVDPSYPDAHRDPALRAWLLRRGAEGVAALIRYSERDGFALFPPNMSDDGQWHEQTAGVIGPAHSVADVAQALGGMPPDSLSGAQSSTRKGAR